MTSITPTRVSKPNRRQGAVPRVVVPAWEVAARRGARRFAAAWHRETATVTLARSFSPPGAVS